MIQLRRDMGAEAAETEDAMHGWAATTVDQMPGMATEPSGEIGR